MTLIERLAAWVLSRSASAARGSGGGAVSRRYAAADNRHWNTTFRSTTTSADTEIASSLTNLRGRSRTLGRDAAYARRAKTIVKNNIVFTGIGMQAQIRGTRGELRKPLNDAIEEAFCYWWEEADAVHTGGELAGPEFESQLVDQVFEAGEVFVRIHRRAFGRSEIPLALELIESERCPHEFMPGGVGVGITPALRMGVEHDEYHRPLRYWFRDSHPGDVRFGTPTERVFAVPADEIIHLRVISRWPQHRGVPWMHAVADALNNMRGYTESEIVAARGGANFTATEERGDWNLPAPEGDEEGTDEQSVQYQMGEPGTIYRPPPGTKLTFNNPNRPNTALDPFMRYMLREVAAGLDITYESLSRDYSQSNYSSSRLAALDDRDLWRVLQLWFIRAFRLRIHRVFLQQAMLARAITGVSLEEYALDPRKFEAVKFKPRGWAWVDPRAEIDAFKAAITGGLDTRTAVIAATGGGRDIEDIDEERRQELDEAKALNLKFDTDPEAYAPPKPTAAPAPSPQSPNGDSGDMGDGGDMMDNSPDSTDTSQRMRVVR